MSVEEIPAYNCFYFHVNIIDKEHRDNCLNCQYVMANMNMFVDTIAKQEAKIDDE